jgi:hypothetical protein
MDVDIIHAYMKSKLTLPYNMRVLPFKYNRNFWYQTGTNEGLYVSTCSHMLEVGFDDILNWFTRNQIFIKEVKEKVHIVGPATFDEEDEDEDEENDDADIYN